MKIAVKITIFLKNKQQMAVKITHLLLFDAFLYRFFSVFPWAEDGGADAHKRRSVFDGDLPIVAHAHAQLIEILALVKAFVFQGDVGAAHKVKFLCHLLHIIGE